MAIMQVTTTITKLDGSGTATSSKATSPMNKRAMPWLFWMSKRIKEADMGANENTCGNVAVCVPSGEIAVKLPRLTEFENELSLEARIEKSLMPVVSTPRDRKSVV